MENTQLFSPTVSHYSPSPQSQSYQHQYPHSLPQSPLSTSHQHHQLHHGTVTSSYHQSPTAHRQSKRVQKRKRDGDGGVTKKLRHAVTAEDGPGSQEPVRCDWPIFQLPQGGVVQQSPFGMIKVIKEGKSEKATLDNDINLSTFAPAPEEKQVRESVPMIPSPSPSVEVESYMIEGYREINRSYHLHEENIVNVNYSLYDHSHEDADIDCDWEM